MSVMKYLVAALPWPVLPLVNGRIVIEVTGCSLAGAQVNMTMGALTYMVQNPGVYSSVPANPVAQGSTSGSGSGATFTLSYGPIAAAPSFSTLTPGGGNAIWGFYGTG